MLSPPSTRKAFPVIQYVAGWHSATTHRATSSGVVRRLCGFRFLAISISFPCPGITRNAGMSVTPARIAFAVIPAGASSKGALPDVRFERRFRRRHRAVLALQLLRRHVLECAEYDVLFRDCFGNPGGSIAHAELHCDFGEADVEQFYASFGDQYVAWLQIAVDHALDVRGIKCVGRLNSILRAASWVLRIAKRWSPVLDNSLQRRTLSRMTSAEAFQTNGIGSPFQFDSQR